MKTEDILNRYADGVRAHTMATEEGNHKIANRKYNEIENCVQTLKRTGKIEELAPFLSSSDDGLRLWTATYFLTINEDKALEILNELANSQQFLSVEAKWTLREWQNGNLKP
jgi:hypothetical protein